MNSPFTREEQMFARDVHRLASNVGRLCDLLEKVIELENKKSQNV